MQAFFNEQNLCMIYSVVILLVTEEFFQTCCLPQFGLLIDDYSKVSSRNFLKLTVSFMELRQYHISFNQ